MILKPKTTQRKSEKFYIHHKTKHLNYFDLKQISLENFKDFIAKGYRIVDLRSLDEFCISFIPGSVFINIDNDFEKNIHDFLYPDQAILVVCHPDNEQVITERFLKAGFNNIAGMLEGGFDTWLKSGGPIDVVISISGEELLLDLKYGKVQLIDIRPKAEYDLRHIEDSDNLTIEMIISHYDQIDSKGEICLICQDGYKSMSLISYLKINNLHNIYHLEGGFSSIAFHPDFEMTSSPTNN